MESTGGKDDDTKRLCNNYQQSASFGVRSNGFGNDQNRGDTLLSKWAHKERTQNGSITFEAH